jgi:hypothetical protein
MQFVRLLAVFEIDADSASVDQLCHILGRPFRIIRIAAFGVASDRDRHRTRNGFNDGDEIGDWKVMAVCIALRPRDGGARSRDRFGAGVLHDAR